MVALVVAGALPGALLLGAAGASAETLTFGSPLAVPATLNTSADLGYPKAEIPIPDTTENLLVYHDGADTLLWNAAQAASSPTAPAGGQILNLSLEGCAEQPNGAPAPLTDIHCQDLVPQAGGGVKINVTTGTFTIPTCGQNGASGSTVTNYQPVNFCVNQGDYVGFNDEGGFVPNSAGPPLYPSGVPYQVIGSVPGSTLDSFIRNGGTNNGTEVSTSDTTSHDGFRSAHNEELLLQETLATGPDATPLCPGGSKNVPAPGAPSGTPRSGSQSHAPLVIATLPQQKDGMNAHGVVEVAVFCHASTSCRGTLTLLAKSTSRGSHKAVVLGQTTFLLAAHHTGKVKVRLSPLARRLVRRGLLAVKASVSQNPQTAAIDGQATRLIYVRGAAHKR
jgi:hypothetical protein